MKKQPTAPSVAEFYHEETKYSPETISALNPDLSARPEPFKQYLSDRSLDLRPAQSEHGERGEASGDDGAPDGSLISRLARLLYFSSGITRIHETPEGHVYRRAAPSAGALYPSEVYLATRDAEGLSDGIHYYHVAEHALVPVWDGDFGLDIEEACFRHAAALRARVFVIVSAIYLRSSWRYLERAYRRILLDSGHVLGNLVAYAPREGFDVVSVAGFCDDAVNQMLFLDPREEAVYLVLPLVERRDPQHTRINSAFPLPSRRHVHRTDRLSDQGVMRLLHERSGIGSVEQAMQLEQVDRSGASVATGAVGGRRGDEIVLPGSGQIDHLPDVIVRRRSARKYRRAGIPLPTLGGILHYAHEPTHSYYKNDRGVRVGECCFVDPTLLNTIVLAQRVDGIAPGLYDLDPQNLTLALRREGDFREAFGHACLGQEIGRDAAAVVIHVADLARAVKRYGDRAYRYLHLDAGHLGQRMNLAATSVRLGVSGIAGFFDEELSALLELPGSAITVYITTLGQSL